MKSNFVIKLVLFSLVFILTIGFGTFGQGINWVDSPNGVWVSNKTPGDTTSLLLRFIITDGAQLTKDQWLEIDLSDFQIKSTAEVQKQRNYIFTAPVTPEGAVINMDNDTTDFGVAPVSLTGDTLRFTLTNENALVPDDTVNLYIDSKNGLLRNKGRGTVSTGENDDIRVKIRSSDQPVFSGDYDADDSLSAPQNASIIGFTIADSNASQSTYFTLVDTARGQIPVNGELKITIPNDFSFGTLDESNVTLIEKEGATDKTYSANEIDVDVSDTTITITLVNSGPIEDGNQFTVRIGDGSNTGIINPTIYGDDYDEDGIMNYDSLSEYSTGYYFNITGLDADGDTIFIDSLGLGGSGTVITRRIVSNWWPDTSFTTDGGLKLSNVTAGNLTNLTMNFQLGVPLDTSTVSEATFYDTLFIDLSDFEVDAAKVVDSSRYTITVGGGTPWETTNSAAALFKVDTVSVDTIKIVPLRGGDLTAFTDIRIVISDSILRNKGANTNLDVSIWTNHQPTRVTDRDVDEVLPNAGGIFTVFACSDTNLANECSIDSLVFITNGQVPRDAQIEIVMPTNFTLNPLLDSVRIDTNGVYCASVSSAVPTGNKMTAPTIGTYNVTFNLALDGALDPYTNIRIMLGNSSTAEKGAWDNPDGTASTDSGSYPSSGPERGKFYVRVKYNDGSIIQEGTNDSKPLRIVTNAFVNTSTWGQWTFYDSIPGRDTLTNIFSGDSIGVEIRLRVGSALQKNVDTLFLDLSDFYCYSYGLNDSVDVEVSGGTRNANYVNWCSTLVFNNDTLELRGHADDTLNVDTDVIIRIAGASADTGKLWLLGANDNVKIGFWTNHQLTGTGSSVGNTWSDTSRTVYSLAANDTTAFVRSTVRSDSIAGEVSIDSFFVHMPFIPSGGSKIAIKLRDGFAFASGTDETTGRVEVELGGSGGGGWATTGFHSNGKIAVISASQVEILGDNNDSLVIELASTDSLWNTRGTLGDTLLIVVGSGTLYGIKNAPADSVLKYAETGSKGRKAFFDSTIIEIFDPNSRLMYSTNTPDQLRDTLIVVSNSLGEGADTIRFGLGTADNAGVFVDTLIIPFAVAQPLVGNGSSSKLYLKFRGLFVNSDSVEKTSNYEFRGDTAGVGRKLFTATAPTDSTIEITLAEFDTLGPADGPFIAFFDTLKLINMLYTLGDVESEGDDIDVTLWTSDQTSPVTDTTDIDLHLKAVDAPTVYLDNSTEGTVGGTGEFTIEWDRGEFYGFVEPKGSFNIYLPTMDRSDSSMHEFFVITNTIEQTNNVVIRSCDSLPGEILERTNATFTAEQVGYEATFGLDTYFDTTKIVLDYSTSLNTVSLNPDSGLVIELAAGIRFPFEATNNETISDTFQAVIRDADRNPAPNPTIYGYKIELKDHRGGVISRHQGDLPEINASSATQLIIVMSGQHIDPGNNHAPGTTDSLMWGVPTDTTVNDSIGFKVIAVDNYGNRDERVDAGTVKITSETDEHVVYEGVEALSGELDFIDLANGTAKYTNPENMLKFLTAADGNASLGRSNLKWHTIKAEGLVGITLTEDVSDTIKVYPDTFSQVLVLHAEETHARGDTANDGKVDAGNVDIATDGYLTITAFAVDSFYNRVNETLDANVGTATIDSIKTTNTNARLLNATTLQPLPEPPTPLGGIFDPDSGSYKFILQAGDIENSKSITVYVNESTTLYYGSTTFDVVGMVIRAVFEALADSTSALGDSIDYIFWSGYSGYFALNEGWDIWIHDAGGEPVMNTTVGGTKVRTIAGLEGSSDDSLKTEGKVAANLLYEGDSYWLYATHPTNDSVRAVSTPIIIRHEPVVDSMTITPTTAAGNITRNSGGLPSSGRIVTEDIKFHTRDLNSDSVEVKVFLNTSKTLTKGDITFKGTSPWDSIASIGTGSIELAEGTWYGKNDTVLSINIASPTVMDAGVYYVYVVANDNNKANSYHSQSTLTVKHEPYIGIGYLDRPVAGNEIIETNTQRKLTVSWGAAGDFDVDDNATIALFMDTLDASHGSLVGSEYIGVPSTFYDGSSTPIDLTGGYTLYENPDREDDNYVLDLTGLSSSRITRIASGQWKIYALIKDGVDTSVAVSRGDVSFDNIPKFKFKLNLGGALSKTSAAFGGSALGADQINIKRGDVLRISWESSDLDALTGQYIRLIFSTQDNAYYDDFTFTGATQDAWIVNSTDGSEGTVINTNTNDVTYYDWYTERMQNFGPSVDRDGDYYLYAFVTTNSKPGVGNFEDKATSIRVIASGRINISETTMSITPPNVRLIPNYVSINEGETETIDIKVNTKGNPVNGIFISFDLPDTMFTIVDRNDDMDGIQPYIFASDVFGGGDTLNGGGSAVLNSTTGNWEFNLKLYAIDEIYTNNADSLVAQFQVTSKGTEMVNSEQNIISFINTTDRPTKFTYSTSNVGVLTTDPAITVRTTPMARITGNVPLEGRDADFSKEITFELRENGSLLPISNSAFENVNDADTSEAGIQINTDRDGKYELKDVPVGDYYLVAKTVNYLSGHYDGLSIVSGDYLVGINTTKELFVSTVDHQELRGGDVGSGDSIGYTDNYIDDDDIGFLKMFYDFDTSATGYGELGDINGSGVIDLSDLFIATGNHTEEGVPPVYNKAAAKDNYNATLKLENIPDLVFNGDEFDVSVWAHNVGDLKGYQLTVKYNSDKYTLIQTDEVEGDFLVSGDPSISRTVFFNLDDRKGKIYVSSLLGKVKSAEGSGELLTLRFKSNVDGETPNIMLTDIMVGNSDNKIFKLADAVNMPEDFMLRQNFPNPFNPETSIRLQLPEASQVTLKVYNILGQEIKTLVNKNLDAGYHTIRWDGTNNIGLKVASGVYIYRMKAGGFINSKKMVFLK